MSEQPEMMQAQKERREAASWMQRRLFWNWTAEDEAAFECWLTASPSHRIAYLRVTSVWSRTERLTALRRPLERRHVVETPRRKWLLLAGVAAAAIVVGIFAVQGLGGFGQREFATAVGEHQIIKLSDGSNIELNTNSVLRLSRTQRQAWLDRGEAYFQIIHDARRPFSVMVAGKRVEDLGTKFLIRTEPGKLTVGLFEGKAAIKTSAAPNAAQLAVLMPGDVATATDKGLTVKANARRALNNAIAWRQDMLIFSNAPLTDIAEQLNRYNQRKIVIADAGLKKMKIDASIPTNGVDAFVRVAKNFLGLHVREREGEIIISR